MPRIRSLKPGFFCNEDLAELSPWHRLCFAGLWTIADREGRLEDRPRRIKAALFPYDDVDVDELLQGLAVKGFIVRYDAADPAGTAVAATTQPNVRRAPAIAILTFRQHQRPKTDESPSLIPPPVLDNPRFFARDRARIRDRGQGTGDIGTEGRGDSALAALAFEDALDTTAVAATTQPNADAFMNLWNEVTTPPLPRCRDLTTKRRRQIKSRLTERPLEQWREVFLRIQRSTFCRGETGHNTWIASFDWVINSPDSAVKVLEGKYDDRDKPVARTNGNGALSPSEIREAQQARSRNGGCPHDPRCPDYGSCVQLIAEHRRGAV